MKCLSWIIGIVTLFFSSIIAGEITGTVVSSTGDLIHNARVIEACGDSTETYTNEKGEFKLNAPWFTSLAPNRHVSFEYFHWSSLEKRIYWNPNKNPVEIKVADSKGQLINNFSSIKNPNQNSLRISFKNTGVYFVTLKRKGKQIEYVITLNNFSQEKLNQQPIRPLSKKISCGKILVQRLGYEDKEVIINSNYVPQTILLNSKKLKVLIMTGTNDHRWDKTSPYIKNILESTGGFEVDMFRFEEKGILGNKTNYVGPDYPDWFAYDGIFHDYVPGWEENSPHFFPEEEKKFESFVNEGGGLVFMHAAFAPFLLWEEHAKMFGLGWRKATHTLSDGSQLHYGTLTLTEDAQSTIYVPWDTPHPFSHTGNSDYTMNIFEPEKDHPILKDLPMSWLKPKENILGGMRGPAENMTVLTWVRTPTTNKNEPYNFIVKYGQKGEVVSLFDGHVYGDSPMTTEQCIGFQTMVIRSMEYSITKKVTYPKPDKFPGKSVLSLNDSLTWDYDWSNHVNPK